LKITGFFEDVRVLEIAESEVARYADPTIVFMNVNTPEELARARALVDTLERGGGDRGGAAFAPPDHT
jgi:hypothetical protein